MLNAKLLHQVQSLSIVVTKLVLPHVMHINPLHLHIGVLLVLDENKRKITNLRAYLLSLLYNAPINILGMTAYQETDDADYSKDKEIWQELFNTT